MKRCFKCGTEKPLAEFYSHPQMSDGHLNKCKECTKREVSARYRLTLEQHKAYERERNRREARKRAKAAYLRDYRQRHPQRNLARQRVSYALRVGQLSRKPCEVCGTAKSEAHHPDHAKPLAVRWLCTPHHREAERAGL